MKIIITVSFLMVWTFIYVLCKASSEADKKYEELSQKKFAPERSGFYGD